MIKVDDSLRLVFGWAQICTVDGEPYYDTDNQHFPEDVTLKAWSDFMLSDLRAHKAMHNGEDVGEVAFAFPMTKDIAESLGFDVTKQTGVIAGVRVNDEAMLQKFRSGEYKGFSIGGMADFEDVE